MAAADWKRREDRQRRQRAQRTWDDQVLAGGFDDAPGAFALDEVQRDGDQRVAAKGIGRSRGASRDVGSRDQAVGKPAGLLEPEVGLERFPGPSGQVRPTFPAAVPRRCAQTSQLQQQADPERLDLDRVTLARGSRGVVGVHPGEVGGTPYEAGRRIDADPVRGTCEVTGRDGAEYIDEGAAPVIDAGLVEGRAIGSEACGEFFADDAEPEWGVGGVPVRSILAVDRIRERAVLLEPGEGHEEIADFVQHSRGDQAPGGDQGIAPPVEEPRISRNDRAGVIPPDHEGLGGEDELATEGILRWDAGAFVGRGVPVQACGDKGGDGRGGGWLVVGAGSHRGRGTRGEGNAEPTRRPGVAGTRHPAAGFHRVRQAFAPFRLRLIGSRIRPGLDLATGCGSEDEAGSVFEGPGVRGEVMVGASVSAGFAVEAPVFEVNPDNDADVGLRREGAAIGWTAAGAVELEDDRVGVLEEVDQEVDLDGASVTGVRDETPVRGRSGLEADQVVDVQR